MPITVLCSCGRRLQIADTFAGQQGRCPVCGETLDLPALVETPPRPIGADAASNDAQRESSAEHVLTTVAASPEPQPSSPTDIIPEADVAPPAYKLYSAGDATLAAFLGSILAGFLILALNYRRLGRKGAAAFMVVIGLAAFLINYTIATALPERISTGISLGLIGVGLWVVYAAARKLQGPALDAHLRHGGQKASTGAAAGMGVLCGLLLFAVVFALSFAWDTLFNSLGERITFGKDEEIYYAQGVTEDQARALGRYLQQDGFFDGRGAKTVTVARDGNTFVVSFVVIQDSWNFPWTQEWGRKLVAELSDHVFAGAPVEIRLVDENLVVHKTIR